MCLFKLTCFDDDYQTVHWGTKGKLKTIPYYSVQGDFTLETEHCRYNSNALAGPKQRLVNMAVGYHSEQEGRTCSSIQKRKKTSLWTLLAIDRPKGPLFSYGA